MRQILRFSFCIALLGLACQVVYAAAPDVNVLNKTCQESLAKNNLVNALRDCGAAAAEAGKTQLFPRGRILAHENYGDVLMAQGKPGDAEASYRRAYPISERIYGKDGIEMAVTINKIAGALQAQKKFDDAKPLYEKVLALRTTKFGAKSKEAADALQALGMWAAAAGKAGEAEDYFTRTYNVRKEVLDPKDVLIGQTLQNLAFVTQSSKGAQAAEPIFRLALSSLEAAVGPDDVALLDTLESLAALYRGNPQVADGLWRRAAVIRQNKLGPEHPSLAFPLNEIGSIMAAGPQRDQAEPIFRRALSIREKAFGINHLSVAESANNLGVLFYAQGRYAEALPLFRHAAAVSQVALGPNNALTLARWDNLQQTVIALATQAAKQAPQAGANIKQQGQQSKPAR